MKALFVGLGSIGQRHLRNLRKLLGDSVDIIAYRAIRGVPMLDEKRNVVEGGSLKDHYQIREFDDLDNALAEKPDLVFITNPSSMHVEVAKKAAEAGCHLFIEKPLDSSLEGVEDLIALVEKKQLVALVAYQLRFHPGLRQVSSWLKEKRIGQLVSANLVHGEYLLNFHPYEDYKISYAARKELGGGVTLTQIHEFDYALWLFGKPRRVFAVGGKVSGLEIDVEDTASVLMECLDEGKVLPVSLCLDYMQSPPHRSCTIVGEEGRIVLDFYDTKSVSLENKSTGKTETHSFGDLELNQMFLDELSHFLAAVKGEGSPLVDLRSGYDSLQMAFAARTSLETGEVQTLK
jgi:predicted dehydrogenase